MKKLEISCKHFPFLKNVFQVCYHITFQSMKKVDFAELKCLFSSFPKTSLAPVTKVSHYQTQFSGSQLYLSRNFIKYSYKIGNE